MSIPLELLIIAALVLLSGIFAAAEAAVSAVRRNHIEQQAAETGTSLIRAQHPAGHSGESAMSPFLPRKPIDLASNPAQFLPTIRVGRASAGLSPAPSVGPC